MVLLAEEIVINRKKIFVGFVAVALILVLFSFLFIENSVEDNVVFKSVVFPDDEWPHNEPVEWYYWTGHLQTDDGRWFGYELVFFIVMMNNQKFFLVNHAITDISDASFHYTTKYDKAEIPTLEEPLIFKTDGFFAELDDGNDTLHAEVDGYILDLNLSSLKPLVLHHENGFVEYSFGGYTYYYSRTRMNTMGTIVIDGVSFSVNGTSWFDHQWGGLRQITEIGWDWFGIQLDDGSEIMLFTIHLGDERLLIGGTFIDSDGFYSEIMPDNFTINVLDIWVSPYTSKVYPSGWQIKVNNLNFTVLPVVEDQELSTNFANVYWEGACVVSGDVSGRAYVELTGY